MPRSSPTHVLASHCQRHCRTMVKFTKRVYSRLWFFAPLETSSRSFAAIRVYFAVNSHLPPSRR
eukprot:10794965-Alexandrium_andersonii.AAC.1